MQSKPKKPSSNASHTAITTRLRLSGSVYAEDEATLLIAEAKTPAALETMVSQRITGLPLEQIVGWAEFCNHRIIVEPGVFIPRRRTEFLARQAIQLVRPGDTVLDLGCGTGALGLVVVQSLPSARLYATDIDPAAVNCAHRNLDALGAQVYQGDLFSALPPTLQGSIKILIANMPYVPTKVIATLPAEARLYEPNTTLDGGPDGLDLHRRVAHEAGEWLAPHGHLLIETSERQAAQMGAILEQCGLVVRLAYDPELEATVIIATSELGTSELA